MSVSETVSIEASPAAAWAVMIDVERWPEWTPTMRSIERRDSGPFGLGSTARIAVRGQMATTWRVTEYTEERSFTWQTAALPGFRAIAGHLVEPDGDGTRVTLTASFAGPMSRVFGPLFARMTRRNVRIEAESLKATLEGTTGSKQ